MNAVPGDIDATAGPPITVPLRHFVVAQVFLLTGIAVGTGGGRTGYLAQVHLLLAGWVCLTIMGAMTQFVPVWTGTSLYSRRLAALQLPLAGAGFAGLAGGFLFERPLLVPIAGALALAGVWLFVYTIGRTLYGAVSDVTTVHFAWALVFFVLVTAAGLTLALDHVIDVLSWAGISRGDLLRVHATLAVFGIVLTTVAGAIAQLAPMFTQADSGRVTEWLQRAETAGYPVGVLALAGGRLLGAPMLARAGALLVAGGLAVVAIVLAGQLLGTTVDWTPMLTRYAVAAVSLAIWVPLTVLSWWRNPLAYDVLFGRPSMALLVGAVAFVVLGTLYHVVPFIVWVNRYSDRLGLEDVPMIDDLYDGRIAVADGTAFGIAVAVFVGNQLVGLSSGLVLLAGVLAFGGALLFVGNVLRVLVVHSPEPIYALLAGRFAPSDEA